MSDLLAHFTATAVPLMRNVYGAALRMSGRPDVAEDVTQETYLRAYRTFHGFETGTDIKAWLFTIMHSVLINRFRHEQRHPQTPLEELPVQSVVLAQSDPAIAAIINGAPSPVVEAAMRALPDVFRTVVVLVDIEELSYDETARVLDCPVGTVRSRLYRARHLLFAALQDHAKQAGYAVESTRRV